jgi:hypothetical protein
MSKNMIGESVSDKTFNTPSGFNREKFFGTTAKDQADNITGTNEQKAFRGKNAKPKGPFGTQGQEF